MLKDKLIKILSEYGKAKIELFKGHSVANFIRNESLTEIKQLVSNENYKIAGHPGMGNWANIPWLEIRNPILATTAEEGIYITYLFKSDCSGVYLSLQHGITKLKKDKGKVYISSYMPSIRTKIRPFFNDFSDWHLNNIQLGENVDYELSNIASKYYSLTELSYINNDSLEKDLLNLLDIYRKIPTDFLFFSDTNKESRSTSDKQMNILKGNNLENSQTLPKPFLILAGISGTGKTRFVREQAKLLDPQLGNYCLVPVRPDWYEPSDLLGYISRLSSEEKYVATDVLKFIIKAWHHIQQASVISEDFEIQGSITNFEKIKPYWLCLDEMNLAPVEQYFADYLSILETREWHNNEDGKLTYQCDPILKLDEYLLETLKKQCSQEIQDNTQLWKFFEEKGISLPFNLIVAGTVNMDETTHSFSRKVLDRALSFDFSEFYPNNFEEYFEPKSKNKKLTYPIYSDGRQIHNILDKEIEEKSTAFLTAVNNILMNTPFKLGYRALNELYLSLISFNPQGNIELQSVWDDFLMFKVLPRIEGDSDKLGNNDTNILNQLEDCLKQQFADIWENEKRIDLFREGNDDTPINIACRSKAKLAFMKQRLESGFTHFWQ